MYQLTHSHTFTPRALLRPDESDSDEEAPAPKKAAKPAAHVGADGITAVGIGGLLPAAAIGKRIKLADGTAAAPRSQGPTSSVGGGGGGSSDSSGVGGASQSFSGKSTTKDRLIPHALRKKREAAAEAALLLGGGDSDDGMEGSAASYYGTSSVMVDATPGLAPVVDATPQYVASPLRSVAAALSAARWPCSGWGLGAGAWDYSWDGTEAGA
jgi:hypothetical protein